MTLLDWFMIPVLLATPTLPWLMSRWARKIGLLS